MSELNRELLTGLALGVCIPSAMLAFGKCLWRHWLDKHRATEEASDG